MREEYDFSSGVRGKHFKAGQKGYTTIIHQSDGLTVIEGNAHDDSRRRRADVFSRCESGQ